MFTVASHAELTDVGQQNRKDSVIYFTHDPCHDPHSSAEHGGCCAIHRAGVALAGASKRGERATPYLKQPTDEIIWFLIIVVHVKLPEGFLDRRSTS